MFKIARNDSDILVIPNKYVEELRSMPDAQISAIQAHIKVCLLLLIRCIMLIPAEPSRKILYHADSAGE